MVMAELEWIRWKHSLENSFKYGVRLQIWLSHIVDFKNIDGPLDYAFDVCNSSTSDSMQVLVLHSHISIDHSSPVAFRLASWRSLSIIVAG